MKKIFANLKIALKNNSSLLNEINILENNYQSLLNEITLTKKLTLTSFENLKNPVVVVDVDTKEILYENKVGKNAFNFSEDYEHDCISGCKFLNLLKEKCTWEENIQIDYYCKKSIRKLIANSFPFIWEGKKVVIYIIYDLTLEIAKCERLTNLAYTDDLTRVHNRRYCMKRISQLKKENIPFTLTLIDIDNLKFVNDTFGHMAGDEYICIVSKEIQNCIRDKDSLCRTGGDEFVVILPNCTIQSANNKFKNVLSKVTSIKKSYPLAFSYGSTLCKENSTVSTDELLKEADKKMYEFKFLNKS